MHKFTDHGKVYTVESVDTGDGDYHYKVTAYGAEMVMTSDIDLFEQFNDDQFGDDNLAWAQEIEQQMYDAGLIDLNDDGDWYNLNDVKSQAMTPSNPDYKE